jgi:hypothetical protein
MLPVPAPAAALAAEVGNHGLAFAVFTRAQQPFVEPSRRLRLTKDRSAETFQLEMKSIQVGPSDAKLSIT